MGMYFVALILIFGNYFLFVEGNAMLKPKHRGIIWARDAYNSAGYNYMGINCGGTHKVKRFEGKCGLCGDAYDGVKNHETGGKYATGKIAQVVRKGKSSFRVRILLNADQGGYFEFRLCVLNGSVETQACFDQHLLAIREGRLQGDQFAYIVQTAGLLSLNVEIPANVKCDKCVLQWKYVTGNTFGRDEFGHGCLGCGPQETFINCADIRVKGWEPVTVPPPVTPPTTYPPPTPTPPSTAAATTTTTTTTTVAPVTSKPKQITRPNINTQSNRHRQPVTDYDEGSRRGNYRVFNGGKTPAVIKMTAPKKGVKVTGIPIVVHPPKPAILPKPAPAILPQSAPIVHQPAHKEPAVTQPPKVEPKPKLVQTRPVVKTQSKPVRGIGIPFHIPKPPKLSVEQIDALNNNKNVIPQHDSLQKYVKVGSSKIIASQDFATMRAHQVQTPPTKMKNVRDSTSPTLTVPVPGGGNSGIFTVFGGPMEGGVTVRPQRKQEQGGASSFVNEYASAEPKSPSRDSFNQNGHSPVNNIDISINTPKEKPKVRYGRTPTPVPLLPSRYGGRGSQSLDPFIPNRYGKPLPSRYQQNPTAKTQEQQFRPRSTSIPVIETSTHQTSKLSDTIAPWRPFNRNPNSEQTFVDKPLNLFQANKDTTFKPPMINERYTNFQIGNNRRNTPKQSFGQNIDPNIHLNSELHSPESYFAQDVSVYYSSQPGANNDAFPVTVSKGQSLPTQSDRNINSGAFSSNTQYTSFQNQGQQNVLSSFNKNNQHDNVNGQAFGGTNGILSVDGKPGAPRTEPRNGIVSPFVSRQSASTDNFNVYLAAGISNQVKRPNDAGVTLNVPMSDNQKVNVLFDAFDATGNTEMQQQQQQQNHQQQQQQPQQSFQQYTNENLFSGQGNYLDQSNQQFQQQQQQQQQQQYPGHQNQQYQNQYLQQPESQQQQLPQQQQQQLPQQQQFQGLPENQVQFLGQYQKSANRNNANSNLNGDFAFGPNPHAFDHRQSVTIPTSHAWWSNQNVNNQTPPSTPPSPSPTPEKPVLRTTTQQSFQKTTDKMDVQLAELRKLREKLDQLQDLINLRQKGFDGPTLPPTVETRQPKTTTTIPTTTVKQTTQATVVTYQDHQNTPSSGHPTTRGSVRELLEHILLRRYKEQSGRTPITTSSVTDTRQSTTPGRSVIHTIQESATTTMPSTMTRNTAEYITKLKANMLKSIKVANELKQITSKSTLKNKVDTGYVSLKPLNQLQNVEISLQNQPEQKLATKPWQRSDNDKRTVNKKAVLQKLIKLRKNMKQRRLNQNNAQNKAQVYNTPGAEHTGSNTKYQTDKFQTGQPVTNPTPTQPRHQRVTSLTSESVFAALRKMGNRVTGQRKATSSLSGSSLAADMGEQGLEKPRMREMVVQNSIKKQQIIDTTSLSKPTTTTDSEQQRRMKLINKMKQLMFNKPTKSQNNNIPSNLHVTRPSHLGTFESGKLKPNNKRPSHIIDHPNNGRPTADPHRGYRGSANQATVTNTGHNVPGPGNSFQNVQQPNAFFDRVKQIIAMNRNTKQTSKAPTTVTYSTSNARPTPLNKEMFIKMLQSMSKNRHNFNIG